VTQLSEEIEALRRVHLENSERALNDLRQQHLVHLDNHLSTAGSRVQDAEVEAYLRRGLDDMNIRFGPGCAERQAVSSYQFEQLWSLLMPTHMRFLLWLMIQPDEALSPTPASQGLAGDEASTLSLWQQLCQELGFTPEQEDKVQQVKQRLQENKEALNQHQLLAMLSVHLERLQMSIRSCAGKTEQRLKRLQAILTPGQMVRYLTWVHQNRDRLLQSKLEESVIKSMPNATQAAAAASSSVPADKAFHTAISSTVSSLLEKKSSDLSLGEIQILLNSLQKTSVVPLPIRHVKPDPEGDAEPQSDPMDVGQPGSMDFSDMVMLGGRA